MNHTPYVEATLRAWRNLLLEEAVELEEALRYWNTRSERPLLAYVETGDCASLLVIVVVVVDTVCLLVYCC